MVANIKSIKGSALNKNQTSSIEEEAIATISGKTDYSSIEYHQQCNVILPKQAEQLCIDTYEVGQIIQICKDAKRKTTPWRDVSLTSASLFLGIVGSEVCSWDEKIPSTLSWWQAGCLILGAVSVVVYIFIYRMQSKDVNYFAERIEDHMRRCISSYNKKDGE